MTNDGISIFVVLAIALVGAIIIGITEWREDRRQAQEKRAKELDDKVRHRYIQNEFRHSRQEAWRECEN